MLTNLTGEGNNKTIEQQYCSAELSEKAHTYLIFLSVINVSVHYGISGEYSDSSGSSQGIFSSSAVQTPVS